MADSAVPTSVSLSKLKSLNGIFAVFKKEGPTAVDVLNLLKETLLKEAGVENPNPRKRRKQELKMGHGGTLDSAASGVMVVGVGSGTKQLSTMLTGSTKYVAVGEFGKATDTLDATGNVTHEKDFDHITRTDFEEKLKIYTGEIMQVPPLYSALKNYGKPGHEVEHKPARPVTVYNLTLREFSPPCFTLDIECGGGFHVRTLVDDLGKALSSCAHVKELTRTQQGQFTLEDHALREDRWSVDDVMQSLQPCEPLERKTPQPCPAPQKKTPQPCPAPQKKTPQPCPAPEEKTPQPCPAPEEKNSTGLDTAHASTGPELV